MKNWMYEGTSKVEPVISSRIRIARNLKNYAFPHHLTDEEGVKLIEEIEKAFYTSTHMKENFKTIRLWEKSSNELKSYLEKHLISSNLLKTPNKSAFIINREETISLMINEEDHIRLQCITGGFNLREAYEIADKLDSMIEESLEFAFDESLGYLTACPTNLGTGVRASVMIHLPSLTINQGITQVLKALTQVGMTLRGLYGEGSNAEGNIYQISNQVTLGMSEKEIIDNIEAAVLQILQQEYKSRELVMTNYKYEIEDKIFRSLAVLQSARVLTSKECLDLLSNVRLGLETSLIEGIDSAVLNGLLVNTQPATLQNNIDRILSERERDIERAKYVRETLSNLM
ncbi:protein arginine kinase [Clostridium polynesiense]|uniref:protein arginine kinase n=1 Tax=Clostridium polynesiense TaxID=1325933 RepID=UPI00058DA854|nr:protein arginine kinase [Clostridium polynesiense]